MFVLGANLASWFSGVIAIYYAKVYLFTTVAGLNMFLGLAIFLSHAMGNPEVSHVTSAFIVCYVVRAFRVTRWFAGAGRN